MLEQKLETLQSVREYMVRLHSGIKEAAECFQNGDYSKGAELTTQISEGIEYIIKAMTLTSDLFENHIDIEEIIEKLNEVVGAFQNEDYILIGDLYEYEINPIIESYYEEINKVLEKYIN
jgi:hypothetical protein